MSNEENKLQDLVEVPTIPEGSTLAQESAEGFFKSSILDQAKVSAPKQGENKSAGGMFSSSIMSPEKTTKPKEFFIPKTVK